jgi:hypothetical protein
MFFLCSKPSVSFVFRQNGPVKSANCKPINAEEGFWSGAGAALIKNNSRRVTLGALMFLYLETFLFNALF